LHLWISHLSIAKRDANLEPGDLFRPWGHRWRSHWTAFNGKDQIRDKSEVGFGDLSKHAWDMDPCQDLAYLVALTAGEG
jgi:hypothetical protein